MAGLGQLCSLVVMWSQENAFCYSSATEDFQATYFPISVIYPSLKEGARGTEKSHCTL